MNGNVELFDYLMNILEARNLFLSYTSKEYKFLSKDVLLEFQNKSNSTCLLEAAKANKFEMFKKILSYGANIYTQDIKLQNCLYYATLNENRSFIKYILNIDSEKDILLDQKNI